MAQQQQFGMFGPSNDPWAETFANIDRQAGMGTMQTIGSLAGRGTAQLMGGFGFKPAAVQRQEQINEAMKAARDPGGDLVQTYKNLADELHARGMVEEAMKAEQMYSDAQMKKQEFDMKQENIESLIGQRKEREATRKMLADAKLADKPWGAQAMKLYEKHMAKFDPASWTKWFNELERTNGDFQAAAAVVQNIDKKDKFSDPFKDEKTGRWVQKNLTTDKLVPYDKDAASTTVKVFGNELTAMGRIKELTEGAVTPTFFKNVEEFRNLENLWNQYKRGGSGSALAFKNFQQAYLKANKTDSQVARAEIEAMRTFGSLGQRVAQKFNAWLSGTPTEFSENEYDVIMKARRKALEQVSSGARKRLNASLAPRIASGVITQEDVDLATSKLDWLDPLAGDETPKLPPNVKFLGQQ